MKPRRFAEFVVSSGSIKGSELTELLGPADVPVESAGVTVGLTGSSRVWTESAWAIVSKLDEQAPIEDHLTHCF